MILLTIFDLRCLFKDTRVLETHDQSSITHTDVGMMFGYVCLSVYLLFCLQHYSKTNDPKVFQLGVGNDLGISYKWCGFGVERSKVTGSISAFFTLTTITPTISRDQLRIGLKSHLFNCAYT